MTRPPGHNGRRRGDDAPTGGAAPHVHPDHTVRFYEDDGYLCGAVARFLMEGLADGVPVLALLSRAHRGSVEAELAGEGVDVEHAVRAGELTLLDARDVLDRFLGEGHPDAARFREVVGGLLDRVGAASDSPVRVYGEMVDILCREGRIATAIQVEELWNELAGSRSFTLLCAYALDSFDRESASALFHGICRQHARVVPAESCAAGPGADEREREISRLQQKARALESEVRRRRAVERALRSALAERRRSEESLRAARDDAERASRARSDFQAVMSHELRTPLTAILGYEDLLDLELKGPINEEQRAFLRGIRGAANQLTRLIEQIFTLSRIEAGNERVQLRRTDPGRLASRAVARSRGAARDRELHLELEVAAGLAPCHTDPEKAEEILSHLLSNAVKFTRAGSVRVEVGPEDGYVRFDVRDTGVGIDPDDLERIFRPFEQLEPPHRRREGGAGLGLAVSRRLAGLLGGEIRVESGPGEGSLFTLRLPLHGPGECDPCEEELPAVRVAEERVTPSADARAGER